MTRSDDSYVVFALKCLQLWDLELVKLISSHPAVRRVVALGTIFALELEAEGSNAGYLPIHLFLFDFLFTGSIVMLNQPRLDSV